MTPLFRAPLIALLSLLTACIPAWAATNLLPAESAFPLSAHRADNGDVLLVFDAKPGYALYKNRITVTMADGTDRVAKVVKPAGEMHEDVELGQQEQYRGRTAIRVVVNEPWQPLKLHVRSQGCADAGVCYPPLLRTVSFP